MNVHVCVHICTGIYLHVMYVYMWINLDIPSFLCHLISFTSLPLPDTMSLSCFWFIKNKIQKN